MALIRDQCYRKLAFYVSEIQGIHSKLFVAFMHWLLWVVIPRKIDVEYFAEYCVLSVPRNQNKVTKESLCTHINNITIFRERMLAVENGNSYARITPGDLMQHKVRKRT